MEGAGVHEGIWMGCGHNNRHIYKGRVTTTVQPKIDGRMGGGGRVAHI